MKDYLLYQICEFKEAMGVSELEIDPAMLEFNDQEDFDPDAHDKMMAEIQKNFNDDFDEEGDLQKPIFSDLEEMEEEIVTEKRKKV